MVYKCRECITSHADTLKMDKSAYADLPHALYVFWSCGPRTSRKIFTLRPPTAMLRARVAELHGRPIKSDDIYV
jgi:hypothetical protein